jgi:hypothetical protein
LIPNVHQAIKNENGFEGLKTFPSKKEHQKISIISNKYLLNK